MNFLFIHLNVKFRTIWVIVFSWSPLFHQLNPRQAEIGLKENKIKIRKIIFIRHGRTTSGKINSISQVIEQVVELQSYFPAFTAPFFVHGEGDCDPRQRWQPHPFELLRFRALRLDKGGEGLREEPLFEDVQGERRDHHARRPHLSLSIERGSLLLCHGIYTRE